MYNAFGKKIILTEKRKEILYNILREEEKNGEFRKI